MGNERNRTIVALIAISEYAQAKEEQNSLEPLDHSAEQQSRLRTLFESPRYRDAGFEVLDLEPFSSRGDVLNRLEQVGNLARSDPNLNVLLIWSGHGRTFDRKLRLATPESTKPLHEASGLPAAGIIIQCGAKAASRSILSLMREDGEQLGRFKVRSLMRELDLVSKQPGSHAYKRATVERLDIPNTLNREFDVPAPNQVWCGDITYIWAQGKWHYWLSSWIFVRAGSWAGRCRKSQTLSW